MTEKKSDTINNEFMTKIDGFSEVRDLTVAVEELNPTVLGIIDNEAVKESIKIAASRIELEKTALTQKNDIEKIKIERDIAEIRSNKLHGIIIFTLLFGFLFFATAFLIYLGKDVLYEKVLVFVFGFLGGIGGGYYLGETRKRTSINNDD